MPDYTGTGLGGALQAAGQGMMNIAGIMTDYQRLQMEQEDRKVKMDQINRQVQQQEIDGAANYVQGFGERLENLSRIDPSGALARKAAKAESPNLYKAFTKMGYGDSAQLLADNFGIPQARGSTMQLINAYKAGNLSPDQMMDLAGRLKSVSEINQYIKSAPKVSKEGIEEPQQDLSTMIRTPGEIDLNKPTTKADLEKQFRTEYVNQSKDFYQQVQAYNRIKTSAKDPSAAGDVALIFNYMKMLDPSSVVREGEFETARKTGGISDSVWAWFKKIENGERLTPNIRRDFVNRSKMLYKGAIDVNAPLQEFYKKRAEQYQLDANNIIPTYAAGEEPANKIAQIVEQVKAAEEYLMTPEGKADPDAPAIRKQALELRKKYNLR